MVKISFLKAKGFKQLDIDKLVFPEKGTVLIVGKNESGKSTLFEAVYFALFGRGLVVGPGGNLSLISYTSDEADVELGVVLRNSYMTICRKFNRQGETSHYLEIKYQDGKREVFEKATAVNNKILQEIGLDSDSLLNSCFVEQKNLDKIENISPQQREKAIARLLNLDGFIYLEEKLKDEGLKLENDLKSLEKKKELINVLRKLPVLVKEKDELDDYLNILSLQEEKDILAERVKQANSEMKYLENDLNELDKSIKVIEAIDLDRKQKDLLDLEEMKNILFDIDKKDISIKNLTNLKDLIKNNMLEASKKEKRIQELNVIKEELQNKENTYHEMKEVKNTLEKVLPLIERLAEEKIDLDQRGKDIDEWIDKNNNYFSLQERFKYLKDIKLCLKEKYLTEKILFRKNKEIELLQLNENEAILLAELKILRTKTDGFKERELLSSWQWLASSLDNNMLIGKEISATKDKIDENAKVIESLCKERKVINRNIFIFNFLTIINLVVVLATLDFIPLFLRVVCGIAVLILLRATYKNRKMIITFSCEIDKRVSSVKDFRDNLLRLEGRKQSISDSANDIKTKNDLEDLLKKKGFATPENKGNVNDRVKMLDDMLDGIREDDVENNINKLKDDLSEIESRKKRIEEDLVLNMFSGEENLENPENSLNKLLEKKQYLDEEINRLMKNVSLDIEDAAILEAEIARVEKEIERQVEDSKRISVLELQLDEKKNIFEEHKLEIEKMAQLDSLEVSNINEILTQVKNKVLLLHNSYVPGSLSDTLQEIVLLESKIKDHEITIDGSLKEAQIILGEGVPVDIDILKKDISFYEDEKQELLIRLNKFKGKFELDNDHEKIITKIGFIMKEIEKDRTELESETELINMRDQKEKRMQDKIESVELNAKRIAVINEKIKGCEIDKLRKEAIIIKKDDLIGAIRFHNLKRDELRAEGIGLTKTELDEGEDGLDQKKKLSKMVVKAREILIAARKGIFENVLPRCEINMSRLIPFLTADRYRDVRIDPSDYRLEIFDDQANSYIPKKMFSGGTKDQFSLALRLSFALATLPEERGSAPSFIFLDEPISAFDEERRDALVNLLINGELANAFDQIFIISHFKELEGEFSHKIEMVNGRVKQN